jgi:hypothetical protein
MDVEGAASIRRSVFKEEASSRRRFLSRFSGLSFFFLRVVVEEDRDFFSVKGTSLPFSSSISKTEAPPFDSGRFSCKRRKKERHYKGENKNHDEGKKRRTKPGAVPFSHCLAISKE